MRATEDELAPVTVDYNSTSTQQQRAESMVKVHGIGETSGVHKHMARRQGCMHVMKLQRSQ